MIWIERSSDYRNYWRDCWLKRGGMKQCPKHEILDAVQAVSIGFSTKFSTASTSATPFASNGALPNLLEFDDEITPQQHRRHSIEIGTLDRAADNAQPVADIRKGTEWTIKQRKKRTYGYAGNEYESTA